MLYLTWQVVYQAYYPSLVPKGVSIIMQFKKIIGRAGSIRLALAFVAGLFIGILAARVGEVQNILPYLLFPLVVGMVGAFTVSKKNPRPYLVALATGLVGWAGISLYLDVFAVRTASSSCTAGTCQTGDIFKDLLTLYLLIGFVLVALSSLLTSTMVRYYRLERNSRF
jgi:tellurite resistance protein TehA-like permease